MKKAFNRGNGDGRSGKQDQQSFKSTREVLGLAVAKGVSLICGPFGDRQHRQRHHRASQIDHRFEGIRE